MSRPLAYGIDFGTTNSSIAVAREDSVDILHVEPTLDVPTSLPSVAYLHRNGNRAAGSEAVEQFLVTGAHQTACSECPLVFHDDAGAFSDCRQFRPGGGCHDARLVAGLKGELAQLDFEETHSWATDFSLSELVAVMLGHLKRVADREVGARVTRAVIGYPVVFAGAEGPQYGTRQRAAQDRLVQAARLAGFEEVELFPEPAAAILDEAIGSGVAVAVDFGGGTFDVAVMEVDGGRARVTALGGAAIGGERFDAKLFDVKVAPVLGLDDEYQTTDGRLLGIPRWFRNRMATLGGVKHLLSDPNVPELLKQFRLLDDRGRVAMVEEILFSGHAFNFYRAIESAKIKLSDARKAIIDFHRPDVDVSVPLARDEFEELIADDLDVIVREVETALGRTGVNPEDVSVVLRTGGSSQIPAFVDRLESLFGPEKVQERPAFTTVVHGLGSRAKSLWS